MRMWRFTPPAARLALPLALLSGGLLLALPRAPTALTLPLFMAMGLPPLLLIGGRWAAVELLAASSAAGLLLLSIASGLTAAAGRLEAALPLAVGASWVACLGLRRARPTSLRLGVDALADLAMALGAVLATRWLMAGSGVQPDGEFVAHGWLARDTPFFAGLAEAAARQHALPAENPFMAGAPLHYAALGSYALAGLSLHVGQPCMALVWPLSPLLLAPAPVLLRRLVAGRGWRGGLLQLALLSLLLLRPELLFLPQAQSLSHGLLLLAMRLAPAGRPGVVGGTLLGLLAIACIGASGVLGPVAMAAVLLSIAPLLRRPRLLTHAVLPVLGLIAAALLHQRIQTVPYPPATRPLTLALLRETLPTAGETLALLVATALMATAGMRRGWKRWPEALAALAPAGLYVATVVLEAKAAEIDNRAWLHFNGPRLLVGGLMLQLAATRSWRRPEGLWPVRLAVACLVGTAAFAATSPGSMLRQTLDMPFDKPERWPAAKVRLLERMRTGLPNGVRVVPQVADMTLPAFTGLSQSPVGLGIWAPYGMEPMRLRSREHDAMYLHRLPPLRALEAMDEAGWSHWLLQIPPRTPEIAERLLAPFPPGSLRVAMQEPGWVLVERVR